MKKVAKALSSFSLCLLVMLPIIFSTSCAPINKEDIISDLFPNLWVFLTHIFAAIILLIVCIYIVWKPTKTNLAKRQEYIQNEINKAEEIRKDALKQLNVAEQTKIDAFENAKKIIDDANKQAYQNKLEIEQQAINNSEKVRLQAESDAKKIKTKIEQTMNQQIVDIALAASSSLLKSKVSKKDSEDFINDFISTLNKNKAKGRK